MFCTEDKAGNVVEVVVGVGVTSDKFVYWLYVLSPAPIIWSLELTAIIVFPFAAIYLIPAHLEVSFVKSSSVVATTTVSLSVKPTT